MTEVQWFVIIQGKKEGPFTIAQLLRLRRVNLRTWAWREGMDNWKRIQNIPELRVFFETKDSSSKEPSKEKFSPRKIGDEAALSLSNAEPPWIFWLIFFLLIGAYAIWQLYFSP